VNKTDVNKILKKGNHEVKGYCKTCGKNLGDKRKVRCEVCLNDRNK